MKRPPTDLKLLEEIYDRHVATFIERCSAARKGSQQTPVYIPIDIPELAKHFGIDPELVFGHLYYHLDQKHGYQRTGSDLHVPLFTPVAGSDRDCVNFPLLTGVLGTLREEQSTQQTARRIAVASLILSIVSLVVSSLS